MFFKSILNMLSITESIDEQSTQQGNAGDIEAVPDVAEADIAGPDNTDLDDGNLDGADLGAFNFHDAYYDDTGSHDMEAANEELGSAAETGGEKENGGEVETGAAELIEGVPVDDGPDDGKRVWWEPGRGRRVDKLSTNTRDVIPDSCDEESL